jgi:hypothetical protein
MTALSDMLAALRQPTRACGHRGCSYAARHGAERCGEHQLHEQPPEPDADAAELDRLAVRVRQRRDGSPGADPFRVENQIRASITFLHDQVELNHE